MKDVSRELPRVTSSKPNSVKIREKRQLDTLDEQKSSKKLRGEREFIKKGKTEKSSLRVGEKNAEK